MKYWIRRVLNLLLYLSLCFMLGTGLLMWLRLPHGLGRASGGRHGEPLAQVFGLTRHEWGDLHLYVALGFCSVMLVHLVINWAWLTRIAGYRRGWPLLAGLMTGLAIVAVFLLAPVR
ncbi:MAG: DUF4405 domain-containing protein [Phycisphaeraceae bacterium]|nr:DUF4405 domain-containing protein [Phycisphaeraceae bacterium]